MADGPDAWALGHQYLGGGFPPLVEQWNGTEWSIEPSPPFSTATDILAFTPSDVWTTGIASTGPGFARWNGTSWTHIPSPSLNRSAELFSLSGPATNRLFAVGTQDSGVLIEQWGGASWKVVPAPSPGSLASLLDVARTGSGLAWAVGTIENNFGGPLIERTCRG